MIDVYGDEGAVNIDEQLIQRRDNYESINIIFDN